LNKAVCQIRTRSEKTDKIVDNACACEECKEKFENNQLPKCSNCGRLETKDNFFHGKHVCDCIRNKEAAKEKELPILPHERRQTAFYERQINGLREELNTAEVEIDTHLEALEIAEDWHKRQKQELVEEIERLKKENNVKEERIRQLEEQLAQLNSQSVAQIEVKETKK